MYFYLVLASATDATKFNSGGNIVVAGLPITVPENLLVQFPATFVGFRDFAANAGQYGGFEVNVEGNYVNGQAIAGRVSISQLLGGIGGGLISAVNLDGTINIAGGPTLRINTPGGVYGPVYDKNKFFTSDEQNPSVSSFSGYPMCVPRSASDPDCPSTNRAPNGDRVYTPRNTSAMAPFIPGDYVTWSGITNGGEILVYTLTAENVQQKTSADNGDPLYLRVEDVIIAINDGTPNIEVGTTKFTGYLSDGSGSVSVYRLDVDPCTGAETEVQVAAGQLKAGDVRNKFDIRFSDTGITKLAREYRIKANKGAKTVAFGIQAGQYTAPISAVIWPENNVPGTTITQNAFNLFGQLKDGFVFNNQQWGQLTNKWPGAPIPTTAKQCTGNELSSTPSPSPAPSTGTTPPSTAGELPIANAGQPLSNQLAGSLITIAGSNTNAKLTDPQLTFSWTGPTGITINNADKPTMTFVNPMLNPTTSPTTNKFTLKICLASDATACNSATVDVTTNTIVDKITITSYQFANKNGGTVTVSAKSDNILKGTDGANLQLQITPAVNKQIPAMTPDPVTPGLYSIVVPGVGKQPTQIGVTSKYNTKAVTASTLFRRSWVRF
ncbi:hypothetical protein E8E13_008468 [Curvularia kusanoi]|uniref:Uncharacterized protein n=1 Tax=Curvularia kusanoi TaxID=90978 RepID=A0A9P4TAB8_CURKU|nr:hypothetical protein E8E13_008468 [Curvularia kusanoi]